MERTLCKYYGSAAVVSAVGGEVVHLLHLGILTFDNLLNETIKIFQTKTEVFTVSTLLVCGLIKYIN
jgi:hypothetical protein